MPNHNKSKKPWPTQDAMTQIYEKRLWGTNGDQFYSGEGSHDAAIVQPYVMALNNFLRSFKPYLSLCDLGCGDFNIGRQITPYTSNYTGIDIVPDLIKHCKVNHSNNHISFKHLDLAQDELPVADIAIMRQVIQHLSNDEILSIVPKLYRYKYLIVTEHLPQGIFEPNLDIISGQGIRLKKGSGVDLSAAPFHLTYKRSSVLVTTNLEEKKGLIKTICYEL